MPPKLRLKSLPQKDATFIEPMECLAVPKLPEAANWVWEVKIDGYRAIAVKSDRVNLYRGKDLIYVARVRNGFVPASRRHLFENLRPLVISECPFINLPERHRSRWGEGLTADDMKKCIWLQPELVAQIDFLEWTESDHLRHSKFVALRDDKNPRDAVKER